MTRRGCGRGEDSEGCTRLREGRGRKSEAVIRTDFTKQGLGTANREGRSGRHGDFGHVAPSVCGRQPFGGGCSGLAPRRWQQRGGAAAGQGDSSPCTAVSQWVAHPVGASASKGVCASALVGGDHGALSLVYSMMECSLDPPSRTGHGLGHGSGRDARSCCRVFGSGQDGMGAGRSAAGTARCQQVDGRCGTRVVGWPATRRTSWLAVGCNRPTPRVWSKPS